MKVILLQELKGKGGEGDVVDVAPGFANNYLLPQKVAILATKGNLKQLEQRKHNIAKREENRLADAGKIKETLDGALVKVEAKVGEEGQLFGSVTAQMIADAIKAATDVDVDRSPHRAGPRHQDGRPARGDHLAVPRHQDDGEAVRRRRGRRGRSCRGRGCRGDDRGSRRGSRRGDRRGR